MTKSLLIPQQLTHPFFYEIDEEITLVENEQLQLEPLFVYEAAYYQNIPSLKPWENPFESIPPLIEKWNVLDEQLEQLFTIRAKQETLPLMKQGIGLFIQFLHWLNRRPVILSPAIDYSALVIYPININERLQFIMTRPTVHHAFKQLRELMVELEKSYRKEEVLAKHRK